MAKESENSAERELLKAIESESGQQVEMGSSAENAQGSDSGSSLFKGIKDGAATGAYSLTLQDTQKILTGLVVFFLIWFCVGVVKGVINLSFVPDYREAQTTAGDETKKSEAIRMKDVGYYMDVLIGRNIFKPGESDKEEVKGKEAPVKNLVKNLKIAGLAWIPGTKERYALIEDSKTGITYFLRKGDSVSVLKVKEILDNKVVLSHMSEEITLK